MKFVDEAEIYVKAGDGGRGCVSFGAKGLYQRVVLMVVMG
jgi:GTPase involved in cell partitioning and DNA repair